MCNGADLFAWNSVHIMKSILVCLCLVKTVFIALRFSTQLCVYARFSCPITLWWFKSGTNKSISTLKFERSYSIGCVQWLSRWLLTLQARIQICSDAMHPDLLSIRLDNVLPLDRRLSGQGQGERVRLVSLHNSPSK